MAGLFAYAWIYDVQAVRERSGWFLTAIMLALASVQFLLTGILAQLGFHVPQPEVKAERLYARGAHVPSCSALTRGLPRW